MRTSALFFEPVAAVHALARRPRLESWNASDHPDQRALAAYLDHVEELLRDDLPALRGAAALRLDVGLPAGTSLLVDRDLDNYLLPVARRLQQRGVRLVSVTGSKRHTEVSRVGVGMPEPREAGAGPQMQVQTTASSGTRLYKEQIRDSLTAVEPLPPGPVRLDLAFRVGPHRSWTNLWKPSIDSLGPLLGDSPLREWHPDDGRVTELGLHVEVDAALGNRVEITVLATAL